MGNEYVEPDKLAYLMAREQVTDEELVHRMCQAPEMVGSLLMQLSAFGLARQEARVAGGIMHTVAGSERPQPVEWVAWSALLNAQNVGV